MFCKNCGNRLNPGEVFCSKCGARVEDGSSQNSTTEGYPVQDLAGYKTGEPYHFNMRTKLPSSGDDFALRDYQRNSVDAFYADGKPEGGAGVIALPCGTGKTVVGIAAMHKTQTKTLIIVTGVTACRQWRDEILDKTDIPPEDIGEYNGLNK